jgi:hypothetical protein
MKRLQAIYMGHGDKEYRKEKHGHMAIFLIWRYAYPKFPIAYVSDI